MSLYIRSCLIFMLSANAIICRSIKSNTVATIIDAANESNVTFDDMVLISSTEATPRTFDICEEFDDQNEFETLKLRDRGITVVMRLA